MKKVRPPQQETDAPPFPFAKLGLGVSGPYLTTLSGNKYIISFVDWYSGWPEAFPVPDKSAETVAHSIVDEIIPSHSTPLQIVSDNGSENVNKVIKHTLEENNISHISVNFSSCFYNVEGDFLLNKNNFVGGDKLSPVFKHGFLRKTDESLSSPTKLFLFKRKSPSTL